MYKYNAWCPSIFGIHMKSHTFLDCNATRDAMSKREEKVYYRTSWCENTTGKSYRDFPARNSANSQITPAARTKLYISIFDALDMRHDLWKTGAQENPIIRLRFFWCLEKRCFPQKKNRDFVISFELWKILKKIFSTVRNLFRKVSLNHTDCCTEQLPGFLIFPQLLGFELLENFWVLMMMPSFSLGLLIECIGGLLFGLTKFSWAFLVSSW